MGTRSNRLAEAVLSSTHNLCFEVKYEKYQSFLSENFQILVVKFSIHLNRRVFVMVLNYDCSKEAISNARSKFSLPYYKTILTSPQEH